LLSKFTKYFIGYTLLHNTIFSFFLSFFFLVFFIFPIFFIFIIIIKRYLIRVLNLTSLGLLVPW
jgi:hypothetical protein